MNTEPGFYCDCIADYDLDADNTSCVLGKPRALQSEQPAIIYTLLKSMSDLRHVHFSLIPGFCCMNTVEVPG